MNFTSTMSENANHAVSALRNAAVKLSMAVGNSIRKLSSAEMEIVKIEQILSGSCAKAAARVKAVLLGNMRLLGGYRIPLQMGKLAEKTI